MSGSPVRFRLKGTDEYIAPLASADLAGAPAGGTEVRPYDVAGGTGRRSRSWVVGGHGPNAAITYALDELRRKSRDQIRKNPYAAAASDKLVSNIVGTGIVPKSTAPDPAFRQQVADLWLRWTDEADSTGALDFYGLQALAVRGMIDGGESFVRLRTRRSTDPLLVPLQLQLMEGDQCPHTRNDPGQNIKSGIRYNGIGQRVAYLMLKEHPGEGVYIGAGLDETEVPAEDIAHLYRPLRPGQDRGEPWLTRALKTLFDLDAYLDAELVRKKNAAMLVGFIKTAAADTTSGVAGSDEPDEEGVAPIDLVPGTMQVLQEGEDVTWSNPPDVGPNFDAFVRQALRGVATAAGVLYEELSGDYGQLNDRTLRASLNAFRRAVEMWQHQLVVYQLCRKVWVRWMDLALLSGALKLPAGMKREDAYRVDWIPARWPYIHPVQDIEAQEAEVRAGFATRSQKVSERGYDAEAIDAENAADNTRADRLGLSYTSDGRHDAKSKAPGEPDPLQDPNNIQE
ncbi:phage portal protein [Enterovirga sp. CN4-39]|uniref:phage portal protein n=1 Tax=Enterovirga sp. CN4-39 TaxID=3400910 RepID=UPI003C1207D0